VNQISCSCISLDKRWIVTADDSNDSLLIVWDSFKGIPVKTIFSPHPEGVKTVDISSDSAYIVTVSPVNKEGKQQISLWNWSSDTEAPLLSKYINQSDFQVLIKMPYN
jgi:WD40 repeat protein